MKKLLIVDDDTVFIFICESFLKKYFEVSSVTNGNDAVVAAEANKYDVILMDINLGDISMDGIQTMKTIRQNPENAGVKVLAVTAYLNNRQWFLSEGFDELMMKPLDESKTVEIIHNLLASKHDSVLC